MTRLRITDQMSGGIENPSPVRYSGSRALPPEAWGHTSIQISIMRMPSRHRLAVVVYIVGA